MKSQTFIIVHDQDILLKLEERGTFKVLDNYKWLFVGQGIYSKICGLDNVIICRDLPVNIEKYSNLLVFTAWYAIINNSLLDSDTEYINLFEYDIEIKPELLPEINNHFEVGNQIVGHQPLPFKHFEFLGNYKWLNGLRIVLLKHKKEDILLRLLSYGFFAKAELFWNTTTNVSVTKPILKELVGFFDEKMLYEMNQDPYIGHGIERFITYFGMKNKYKISTVKPGLLIHYQADSHATQGHNHAFKI
jgi:hypothetical protein